MRNFALASFFSILMIPVGASADTKNFEGFSVGLNLNLVSSGIKVTDGADSVDSFGGKETSSAGLDLAYGIKIGDTGVITLGLDVDLSNPTIFESNAGGDQLSAKQKNRYGVYVAPGTAINKDTLLYGRLGYNRLKGEVTENGVTGTETYSGGSYGLGIKVMLSKDTFVKVEANRLTFSSKDGLKPSATVGTIGFGIKF
jgi:outer membrane immunogenic protein